ncbi:MAG TPA: 50S ribosomal protein L29 [Candidatus Paceibacterota bacterium]|nr:50S ribosomal protein L29 [Candidatus Paceibacterota bacterium]
MAKKLDLKEKKAEELKDMLAKSREELRELRFAAAGARPKNTNAPREARKTIARILTELGNRKRA